MHTVRSTLSTLRDRFAPITHTSTFRSTGQLTPDEFLQAGNYLVSRFPSWSWADASPVSRRVAYLPPGKQFLITRGVPCRRRLDENFAGGVGGDLMVSAEDEDDLEGVDAEGKEDDGRGPPKGEGWLRTGGGRRSMIGDVRTVSDSGRLTGAEEMSALQLEEQREAEIPDMEDDDDEEAIIRDPGRRQGTTAATSGTGAGVAGEDGEDEPLRTYTLHITYTPYYRTPRLYLSGYTAALTPLPPPAMMEDIIGDYKDKTVTLEDFPFFEPGLKMASVHPCRHASVMKTLLDRADGALKVRKVRIAAAAKAVAAETAGGGGDGSGGVKRVEEAKRVQSGMEGLVDSRDDVKGTAVTDFKAGVKAAGGHEGDEWEVLGAGGEGGEEDKEDEDESAIRVDQYLVVFLKFMASVTPGIEHDFTMSL